MNLSATLLLALGMSMDAFAASIGKGAALRNPRFSEALRTGLIFGIIEALTPLVGWAIGFYASRFIIQWDHWVAFSLLLVLGGRMIMEGLRSKDTCHCGKIERHSLCILVCTAIATSLDAMAMGVGLAFLQVNIFHTAMVIGCATMIMVTLGMLIGRYVGPMLGKKAEIIGGLVLIGIGCNILYEHLMDLA